MAHTDEPRKVIPPYLPFSSFQNTLDGWRIVHPSRIDRSVLKNYSGAMQTWLISSLKYFGLIDADGRPTAAFEKLVAAEGDDRKRLLADLAKTGYPFLFSGGFDLSKATQNELRERFAETGAQGETMAKAISFFTALAKAADLDLSPFVSIRRRRTAPSNGARRAVARGGPERPSGRISSRPQDVPPAQPKTAFEVLYELLDVEMEEAEQQAVWTLLKYLKKRGG